MPRLFHSPLLCLIGLLALPRVHAAPDALPWNAKTQGDFVVSLTRDRQGNVWAGTEDNGLARYNPQTHQWTQFTTKDGLGDDNADALLCDWKGRIWVATLNHGVSVYNGKSWKTYDTLTGPLGAHVTAMAICPADGDIWMATSAGLARYSLNLDTWKYYTRAEGLPSDQANALAFDRSGNLFYGSQCDGLAIGSVADDYKTWRVIKGPDLMPHTPTGDGLPSNLINALLVARNGSIYVGTPNGLAASSDAGNTWRYVRGEDWSEKVRGAVNAAPPYDNAPGGLRLLEDYVTCLAEGAAGQIVVGHRTKGYEIIAPGSGARLWPSGSDKPANSQPAVDYVTALLPMQGQPGLVATYGQGLAQSGASTGVGPAKGVAPDADPTTPAPLPALPTPAPPPTAAELAAMQAHLQGTAQKLPVGGAVYVGQDWVTQGDWVGRYGRQYALLCAAASPLDQTLTWKTPYEVDGQMGPHHASGDSLRHYITWLQTDNPRSLYSPPIGTRRQAEWDDHGEDPAYPMTKEGPDVWVTLTMPEGIQRVSLYFFNKDGHTGPNRNRDYLLQVKAFAPTLSQAETAPDLARCRVQNFWGGVYQQFIVRGPSRYYVRLSRNNSYNTIVSGVFIDRLMGPSTPVDQLAKPYMVDVRYEPPPLDPSEADKPGSEPPAGETTATPTVMAARALWTALDGAYDRQDALPLQEKYRLLAYRAAAQSGGSDSLLANWRWALWLWTLADRQGFQQTMAKGWQAFQAWQATHVKHGADASAKSRAQ